MTVKLSAGGASLDDWRRILRGSGVRLDPAHRAGVAASAATVGRILRRGEPVYGINTGFGKLSMVRTQIPPILQRSSATSFCLTPPASGSRSRSRRRA